MSKVQDLYDQAMKLDRQEIEELATKLWDAVVPPPPGEEISPEEWEREWGEEIVRRVEAYERGETIARPWPEVLADLRKKLEETRNK